MNRDLPLSVVVLFAVIVVVGVAKAAFVFKVFTRHLVDGCMTAVIGFEHGAFG
jgi:hypothetical protein